EKTVRYVVSGRDLLRPRPPAGELGPPRVLANPNADAPVPRREKWRSGTPRGLGPVAPPPPAHAGGGGGRRAPAGAAFRPRRLDAKTTKHDFCRFDRPPRVLYLATHGFALDPGELTLDPLLCTGLAFAGANRVPDAADRSADLPGVLTAAEVLAYDLRGTDLV